MKGEGEHNLRRFRRVEARQNRFGYEEDHGSSSTVAKDHGSSSTVAIGEARRRRATLLDFVRRIPCDRLRPLLHLPMAKAAKVSDVTD